jgi:hypothetical protein
LAGAIATFLPGVAGNGYEAIHGILSGEGAALALTALFVGKAVATATALGGGSPGGVFTPALFLGAVMGRLFALALLAGGITGAPGAFALVGMAAVCAATTHAPLMASVLVFELSGDYGLALPLLVATVLATAAARRFRRDSIYTEELRRRGVDWVETPARASTIPAAALPPGYTSALISSPEWLLGRPITDAQSVPGLPVIVAIRRGESKAWVEISGPEIVERGDELLFVGPAAEIQKLTG